ncbi:MAG: sigma-70 family RNA polymerase sigma factor, partial [Candidatus Omnitrophota bacterium]
MSDLDFVGRCIKSDSLAWKEFLQKYNRLIYSYIYSVIRIKAYVFSPPVAEEIFNELISNLIKDDFRKLKTYRGRNNASLASWLKQVTINFCLSYFRYKKKDMISLDEPLSEGFAFSEIIPYRSLSAAEELLRKEENEHLADCIQNLELDDKFFLELRLRWEFSIGEIMDFLKITRGAADMRY